MQAILRLKQVVQSSIRKAFSTFLVIEGRFDRTSLAAIAGTVESYGVKTAIAKLIDCTLESRNIISTMHREILHVLKTIGCTQGEGCCYYCCEACFD
jgi:predicted neutral ceramidase superfamily lipid hydrolase